MTKVLLAQTSFLGDTVLSSPALAALRHLHPTAEIWLLTTPGGAALLGRDPELAGTITYDKRGSERGLCGTLRVIRKLRSLRIDFAYSLHRSLRTAVMLAAASIPHRTGFDDAAGAFLYTHRCPRAKGPHAVDRFLSLFGPSGTIPSNDLRLFPPEQPSDASLARMADTILLFPGSVWPTKRWDAAHFEQLARELQQRGERVCIAGAPEESELCEQISQASGAPSLAARLSLADLLWIIQRARGVVCNDSLPLHIASAFRRPCVAIFCATSPEFGFGPWRNPHARVVEQTGLDCKPCHRHGSVRCPTGTRLCMTGVSPERVSAALLELLSSGRTDPPQERSS